MEIKVFGPGCPRCQQTEKIVKAAVSEAGVEAQVEKITDLMKIMALVVLSTPVVVVDGQIKSVGKVPKKEEVSRWLRKESDAS